MAQFPYFAKLFKQYRLKSGFSTLAAFADAMAEEGLVYSDSIFSHWQRGARLPTDRETLIAVLKIFVKKQGVRKAQEADQLCAATGFGYLTKAEKIILFEKQLDQYYELEEEIETVLQLKHMLNYYLDFLRQGKRGNIYYYNEIEQQLDHILKIIEKSIKFHIYQPVIEIWNYLGIFLWDTGRWEEVERLGEKVIKICRLLNEKKYLALFLAREMSWLHLWQGNKKKAESFAKEALFLSKELNNKLIEAISLHRIATNNNDNTHESKIQLNKALNIFEKNKSSKYLSDTHLSLGHIYKSNNKIELARESYEKSLKVISRDLENYPISLYYLGEIFLKKNDKETARNFFNHSLEIDTKRKRTAGIAWCNFALAQTYKKNEAKKLFVKSANIFNELGMKQQVKTIQKKIIY